MKKIIMFLFIILTIVCIAEQLVYITPKGKKYHSTKNCRTLARSKVIKEIKLSETGRRQPCKVCY
ncbi:MAG: hypothetical protein ACK5NU_11675 [Fusobacterium ulcerans]|uniref:hypothetical protein n=1 Tax=Fusobacterium ulcerans TaxID=861 RepID=UPI003A8BD396